MKVILFMLFSVELEIKDGAVNLKGFVSSNMVIPFNVKAYLFLITDHSMKWWNRTMMIVILP